MSNLDRELEEEMRKQEEDERRHSIVHQPRHTPVQIEQPIYPVTPYYPDRGYPPYPPHRSGPGWGGVLLAVVLLTAPTYFIGYRIILQQQTYNAEQRKTNAEQQRINTEQDKTILTLANDLVQGVKDAKNEVVAAERARADAQVAQKEAESRKREADQAAKNSAARFDRARADKAALVSQLEASIPIFEKRLSQVGVLFGNCLFNSDCEKKQNLLRDKLAKAKFNLEKVRSMSEANIVADPQSLEAVQKETDELIKAFASS